jgi:G3E family GTPase
MNRILHMDKPLIACVGGFLGAGKTTAVVAGARELMSRALRVGIITNDQGDHLVDSRVTRSFGLPTEEIGGGCFCCRFDEFVKSANRLLEQNEPDVVLAEAVGSCTDLAATVYQPLRRFYADRFDLAPLSVLVEPDRVRAFLSDAENGFKESVAYLFQKQLAEADLIVLNKSDLLDRAERAGISQAIRSSVGDIPIHMMSARTGWGISEWVDQLLEERVAGSRALEIDYETYGRAEGSLGWLNATVDWVSPRAFSARDLGERLVKRIQDECQSANAPIAHLKVLLATSERSDQVAVTNSQCVPSWNGPAEFSPEREVSMIINARVSTSPEELRKMVVDTLAVIGREEGIAVTVQDVQAFAPKPPKPRFRFQIPVQSQANKEAPGEF